MNCVIWRVGNARRSHTHFGIIENRRVYAEINKAHINILLVGIDGIPIDEQPGLVGVAAGTLQHIQSYRAAIAADQPIPRTRISCIRGRSAKYVGIVTALKNSRERIAGRKIDCLVARTSGGRRRPTGRDRHGKLFRPEVTAIKRMPQRCADAANPLAGKGRQDNFVRICRVYSYAGFAVTEGIVDCQRRI